MPNQPISEPLWPLPYTQRGGTFVNVLCVAIAMHALVVFGVTFEASLATQYVPPSLEVLLVERSTGAQPEDAEYIAQSSQDGGGSEDESLRPSAPFAAADFTADKGIAPQPQMAASPKELLQQQTEVVTRIFSDYQLQRIDAQKEVSETQDGPKARRLQRQLEIARLTAEINDSLEKFAKRPKKTFLTARTKEAKAAAYMLGWVEEVERMGNFHYPKLAAQQDLNGSLIMVVAIDRQGRLLSSEIVQTSGSAKLDAVATEIVQMAAPYQAFSHALARESDILYITRTWRFEHNRMDDAG